MPTKNRFDRFSARIKNLYIELNDYAYFHSPSEIGRIDRRFTGRTRVLERLKSLFTDYETPSGAYLVTGYRGAGKSSLVSRALSEVSSGSSVTNRDSRLLRLFVPLLPVSLLGELFSSNGMLLAMLTLWIFLLVYLLWTDPKFPDVLENSRNQEHYLNRALEIVARYLPFYPQSLRTTEERFRKHLREERWPSLLRSMFTEDTTSPRARFRLLAQDAFVLSSLTIIAETWLKNTSVTSPSTRFWTYLSMLATYLTLNRIASTIIRKRNSEDPTIARSTSIGFGEVWAGLIYSVVLELTLRYLGAPWLPLRLAIYSFYLIALLISWATAKNRPKDANLMASVKRILVPRLSIFKPYWKYLKDYLRYSNRVFIKINLSQDDIREIDILRLIAKNIHLKYREFNGSWRSDLHWKVVRVVMLILFVGLVYNFKAVDSINSGLKHAFHLSCYFPSQGFFYFEDGAEVYPRVTNRLSNQNHLSLIALRQSLSSLAEGKSAKKDTEGNRVWAQHHIPVFQHEFTDNQVGAIQRLAMDLTGSLDLFIQDIYHRLYLAMPAGIKDLRIAENSTEYNESTRQQQNKNSYVWLAPVGLSGPISLVPPTLDYLLLFYLLATWFSLGFILRWPSIGLVSHRLILRRLKELNEMIETRVTRETGILPAPTGALFAVNFGRRESRTSPNLTERDIEKHLLEILFLIERIPRLTVRPEFVIVFDELDKIQHHENFTMTEKEVLQDDEFQGREFASIEAERERQHKILSLVSNLKHFLTTAPAKFVFIAGREMFDAALADISDRHFFMGSVFNEVLHVPSFHSDDSDGRLPDITSLTEQYLCRFLLPTSWWSKGLRLQVFGLYLEKVLWPDRELEKPDPTTENPKDPTPKNLGLAAREREKLIYELHNFITYLTYRSNGAPKKITRTIERFLVRFEPQMVTDPDNICFGRSRTNLYLRFSYYDQYTFGLVTYLGGPLIFSLNRAIKDYGDKILVSSSFLLDHIYKFHGEGFSWRNLELLPEIVDINRAPKLRELITNIMRFMTKSDISQIVSGLYDFKFNRRITEEISFLSKISEEESAAFNFTLDESLAIKRHFNRKLQKLLDTYKKYPNAGDEKFVNSVAFVRMILGDLHFYDGELDSAIIEYMEAVQALRNLNIKSIRIDTLVLMVRNFLKLGLAFERKKSYESAFVTYGRISAMITQVGERAPFPGSPAQKISHGGKLHKAEAIFNQATFEGIRLIYQPVFSRLQMIEKSTLGGITHRDINNTIHEFDRMLSPQQASERFLIESEFKNKLADILFFKNGPMPKKGVNPYCQKNDALCETNAERTRLVKIEGRRLPCSACKYYHQSLERLLTSYLDISPEDVGSRPWVAILRSFEHGREMADRQNSLKELGVTLSEIGNTFLSCSGEQNIETQYTKELLGLLPDLESGENPRNTRSERLEIMLSSLSTRRNTSPVLNKVEESLTCYVLASIVFELGGNHRSAARESTKIVWVLREIISFGKSGISTSDFESMADLLLPAILRHNYLSHEGTHRLEIEHLKEVLENQRERRPFVESVNLGRLAISASLMESLTVIDEIRLSLKARKDTASLDRRTSPYAMFNSVFARIHMLRLRSRTHFHNLNALNILINKGIPRISSLPSTERAHSICHNELRNEDSLEAHEFLEFMITDSIYCCHEIIRFLAIYGTSYMASHSMRASAHRNLARWCDLYYNYLRDYKEISDKNERMTAVRRLEDQMRRMVGKADMVDLSPNYHAEMALRHFESAKQAHSEGKAYSEMIEKMYYLTDDFADQLEHFCAALERFRINSGTIDRSIGKLKKRLAKTAIYEPDRYDNAGWAALQISREGYPPGPQGN